ncbi:MAG: sulfatase [Polyangiaceae bacterium]
MRRLTLVLVAGLAGCSSANTRTSQHQRPPTGPSAPPLDSALVPTAVASASEQPPTPPPTGIPADANVLVISIDSLRADRLLSHGYAEDVMPNINALEKTSLTYSRFYAVSSYTSQSIAGMLAGRYPSELKRNGSFFNVYPEDETFFPEELQSAGIRTISGQAHFYFKKEKAGFHQGFDVWDLVEGIKADNKQDVNITSPGLFDLATKQLSDEANTKGRFFAWYHFMDPHELYQPHEEKSFGKKAKPLYDGEIYYTDIYVKKLLDFVDAQPWGKRTVVVITADHGEAFNQHDIRTHGFELYDVVTRVPLIVHGPGVVPRTIDEPRSMIDFAPTFLEIFGVKADPAFQGTSLVDEWRGGATPARDVVTDLARTTDNDRRRTLIHGDWEIMEFGDADAYKLFDLANDPDQDKDLSRKNKEKQAEMRDILKAEKAKIKEICPSRTSGLSHKKDGKPC